MFCFFSRKMNGQDSISQRKCITEHTALNSDQICAIAKQHYHTRDLFKFCCTPDTLPKIITFPSFFICNESFSWEDGTHWVAICCLSPNMPSELFDSLSQGVESYSPLIKKFLLTNSNRSYKVNIKRYQPQESLTCGYYALTFLDWRSQGISYEDCVKRFSSNTLVQNDLLVTSNVCNHMTVDGL